MTLETSPLRVSPTLKRVQKLSLLLRPSPTSVGLAQSSWDDVLHVCHSSRVSSPYAISSTPPQYSRSSPARRLSSFLGRYLPQGSSVVVRRIPSSRRLFPGRMLPRFLSVLRRFRSRLGCSARRPPSVRLVVSPLIQLFYQSARAPGYSLCHSRFSTSPSGSDGGGLLRQFYGSGLSQETGMHPFFLSERGGSSASSSLRGSVGSPSPAVHSWSSQCPGGFSQPLIASPRFGMDFMSLGLRGIASPLACHDRPVRDSDDPSSAGVLLADVRPDVGGHRCDVTILGWSTGVCLSPVRPPSSGTSEGSGIPQPGAHVGGSVLDSTPVVPGPSGASGGDSPFPSKKEGPSQTAPFPSLPPPAVHATVDCVSYIRRSARQAGFSNAVAGQLSTPFHPCQLPGQVGSLPLLVPSSGPFCFLSDCGQGG